MEVVSTILKLAQQIAKAAETARRNKARCKHLADRALTIGHNLRDFKDAAGSGDVTSRRSALGRLKAALDDALRLVESRRRQSRWLAWLTSSRTAARFQDVDGRITACVVDLGLEKLLIAGAHGRPHRSNTRDGSWKKKETEKKKDGARNGGGGNSSNKGKKKDTGAKNGTKTDGAAAAASNPKKKGGRQQGWNGGRQHVKGKPAAAAASRRYPVHSMEDDPGSCSVM